MPAGSADVPCGSPQPGISPVVAGCPMRVCQWMTWLVASMEYTELPAVAALTVLPDTRGWAERAPPAVLIAEGPGWLHLRAPKLRRVTRFEVFCLNALRLSVTANPW